MAKKPKGDAVETFSAIVGERETDIELLKDIDSKSELYPLDILPLLPFKPKGNTNAGRTLVRMVIETFDDQLSEKEKYARTGPNQYLLYLGNNRKLAELKIDIINKEIARKIEQFIHGKYAAKDDDLEARSVENESLKSDVKEKWRPEVEPAPRKLPPDSLEKRKLANQAMQDMLRAREKEDVTKDYAVFSKEIKASYTPVWNVPKNHLTGFIAKSSVSLIDTDSTSLVKIKADSDIGLLVRASYELDSMTAKGNKVVVIVPVSLSTLERYPSRNLFIQYCRNIAPEVRSLIVLKIQDINTGLPIYKLQDILREPSGLVRSVIISTDLRQRRYECPANCHIHAFSASMADVPADEKSSFSMLDRFVEMTKSIDHASMIEDIYTRPLLCAAIGSGVTYVSGPTIQPSQETLDQIRPFDLMEVYRDLLTE